MSQMYVTLPSNSSMKYFPDNKLTNYTTRLPETLNLGQGGSWEVGLSEIQYPHNWNNTIDIYAYNMTLYRDMSHYSATNHWLDPGFYSTISEIVKIFNKKLKLFCKIIWDKIESRVIFEIKENHRILLSKHLSEIMGVPQNIRATSKTEGRVYRGKRVLNTLPDLTSLYVYCDLVQHQIVGDSKVPLLRIVPVKGKGGDIVTHTYENIQYVPVKGGDIFSIEIDIRDDTGKNVSFGSGRVLAILHLRKSRSPYFEA